jgi:hypothetical protein
MDKRWGYSWLREGMQQAGGTAGNYNRPINLQQRYRVSARVHSRHSGSRRVHLFMSRRQWGPVSGLIVGANADWRGWRWVPGGDSGVDDDCSACFQLASVTDSYRPKAADCTVNLTPQMTGSKCVFFAFC